MPAHAHQQTPIPPDESASPAKRPPGRPRSPRAGPAILEAARRVLARDGYAALSLEAVAAEAGVGRTTIYRRYRDKRDVVAAALSGLIGALGPIPDTGSTRADLLTLLELQDRLLSNPAALVLTGTLLAEEPHNPELLDRFRRRGLLPVRAGVRAVLERGIERGEVRPDLDIEPLIDLLAGAALQRHLAGLAGSDRWTVAVIDMLWRGIAGVPNA